MGFKFEQADQFGDFWTGYDGQGLYAEINDASYMSRDEWPVMRFEYVIYCDDTKFPGDSGIVTSVDEAKKKLNRASALKSHPQGCRCGNYPI